MTDGAFPPAGTGLVCGSSMLAWWTKAPNPMEVIQMGPGDTRGRELWSQCAGRVTSTTSTGEQISDEPSPDVTRAPETRVW